MSLCSGNEYNLPIDQSLYKQGFKTNPFPSHQMVFLRAHLLATCTKHHTMEIKQNLSLLSTPNIRDYASILKECAAWK